MLHESVHFDSGMLRIAHLADIHIRGLNRHNEYRKVFEAFAEDAKSQHVDHVFVGGDIFHTKTSGLSPEYVDFMSWWLKTLASVSPVHLTLGNHDGNLLNLSRQDAVSPIVNALDNPNVHLYKQSGVYPFAEGYNWCIFSLFDRDGWSNVVPQPGKINIACYHGPVQGAKTETGWHLEDGLPLEFFKGYDIVLLGDIHRTQFLDHRSIEITIDEADLSKYPNAEVLEEINT